MFPAESDTVAQLITFT